MKAKTKNLTLDDFISDYQCMVVRGIHRNKKYIEKYISSYYTHISKEVHSWLEVHHG
jgi:transcription termination factor NusB